MRAPPDNMLADPEQLIADLQRQLGECKAERDEALRREIATAEVLQVINSSPDNLAAVFETILDKAHTVCGATLGSVFLFDGELFRAAATQGYPEDLAQRLRQGVVLSATTQLLDGVRWVHNPDLTLVDTPTARAVSGRGGVRTNLILPLRKDGRLLGAISCNRQEVRPFSDKEVALVENFAAQAVIAMENARLLTETREALEQQTATAEVQQVINSSPGNLQPVFEAMLERALAVCEAAFGVLWTYDGERLHAAALHGVPSAFAEFLGQAPHTVGSHNAHGRLMAGESVVHVVDLQDDEAHRSGDSIRRALIELGGGRVLLAVPLRKDHTFLGIFTIYRQEVRPFSQRQIALLQNFAEQAVVAMENARLLGELRQRTKDLQESLEYQTAISDVLKVISGSVIDLEPVLKTVVSTAIRLCRADEAAIYRNTDGVYRWVAGHSQNPDYERIEREVRIRPGTGTLVGRTASQGEAVQILDCWTDPLYEAKDDARIGGVRTLLGVPLLREGRPIGVIGLARRRVEACTDKEIELVRTFADQAVIAIENTRLLTELRESLEQQQAIAEVLQVINASQGNLQPVFEAMVEKARRLCEADSGHLALPVGDDDRTAAVSAMSLEMAAMVRAQSYAPGRGTAVGRALLQRQSVQIVDIGADLEHAAPHASRMGLISAVVGVPLLREGEPVGAFGLTRREAKPFAERQIELVRTFAAQAVIAIDNARLLQELRQRQAELRVTFDNMGDGVAMFDAELRLAAWNRNFQEILDLPDEFFAQPPTYDGFIRYLALRGEYGDLDPRTEIARLRAEFGDHFRFERIRPDGAILEVRHNPVPGGGFVLMYSDVTERKRAEEEIRIARDTAENALAELKTTQASLIHSEKMASLGQLTGVIGPIDWRHRPRDQEPVEFRQQLCRAVDRIAG